MTLSKRLQKEVIPITSSMAFRPFLSLPLTPRLVSLNGSSSCQVVDKFPFVVAGMVTAPGCTHSDRVDPVAQCRAQTLLAQVVLL